MRSKTSYFNPTLFRKNLTRFWPLWGGASALGALAPLYVLAALIEEGFRSVSGQPLESTLGYYSILAYAVPVISLIYAALCALAVWSWLYNSRSVGMLHSLPITRKSLFATSFLSGMAMMLIPYAVTGALTVLVTLLAGIFEPVGLLVTILGVLGDSFFFFSAATLVVFITGNPFAFAGFYFIFHFIAAGMEWLVSALMTEFYLGVDKAYTGVAEFLSPVIFLMRKLEMFVDYEQITTPGGWIENGDIRSVSLVNGWLIGVYALVGVVLLGCAWALYRRRRSECAGDVVAVGWMKPVFRYGVALCAALSGGTLLYVLFDQASYHAVARPVPFAVCMVIAGIVGYYIASMLLSKSLKVFRGSGKGALATVLVSAALCFVIAADPFGVEDYVPAAGEIMNASIRVNSPYGGSLYVDTLDPALMEKFLDLHRAIVAEKDRIKNQEPDWKNSIYVYLSYWTPEDSVSRYYNNLPISGDSEAARMAVALATDPRMQEKNIFGYVTPSDTENDILDARLTGGYAGMVYNTETRLIEDADLTLEQARTLEAAVRRDIQAGHFGRTMFAADYEEYSRTLYTGELSLNYNLTFNRDSSDERNSSGFYRDTGSRSAQFSISTYCTETVKALEDIGVLDGTHRLLTQAEYDSMERREDGSWDFEGAVVYPGDAYVYPGEEVDASTLH